jgi:hypothetical protein
MSSYQHCNIHPRADVAAATRPQRWASAGSGRHRVGCHLRPAPAAPADC